MFKKTFLILTLLSTFSSVRAQTTPAVGTLPGDVVVDNTGAATYTIPLQVSPGTGGMQPDLSLNYSSRGGNGILGVGWSIGGLSAISRAPQTWLDDDGSPDFAPDPVDFDDNDRFTLDGQRLILVVGNHGKDGAEYRTEVESFSRIKLHGDMNRPTAYFTVETKAGLKMTYGQLHNSGFVPANSPDGAILSWSVCRIEDTTGNYMDLIYDLDSSIGEQVLRYIRYTGNESTGLATYNEVEFVYDDRSMVSLEDHGRVSYIPGGAKISSTKVLMNVIMRTKGAESWRYDLDYEKSVSTSRMRLSQVQMHAGGKSLPPTTIQWSADPNKNGTNNTVWHKSDAFKIPVKTAYAGTKIYNIKNVELGFFVDDGGNSHGDIFGDFNGDGLIDMAVKHAYPGSVEVWAYLNTGSGWSFSSDFIPPLGTSGSGRENGFQLLDLNLDGFTDTLFSWELGGHVDHNTYLSTGTKWKSKSSFKSPAVAGEGRGAGIRYLDLNADGYVDTIYEFLHRDHYLKGAYFNTGSGWQSHPEYELDTLIGFRGEDEGVRFVELNGDGLIDCVKYPSNESAKAFINTGSGWQSNDNYKPPRKIATSSGKDHGSRFVDLNGDGLTDLLYGRRNNDGSISLDAYMNTGAGWEENSNYEPPHAFVRSNGKDRGGRLLDLNADGLVDLLYAWDDDDRASDDIYKAYLNTGSGWQEYTDYKLPSGITVIRENGDSRDMGVRFKDLNGDGIVDMIHARPSGQGRGAYINKTGRPDLMVGMTNGYGVQTSVGYSTLNDPNIYTKGTGAEYPIIDVVGPMLVATSVSKDDGAGGQYVTNYTYAGARSHLRGRGFLGFEVFESHDKQTHLSKIDILAQDYPTAGMVLESTSWYKLGDPEEELLSRTQNTVLYDRVNGGTFFPFNASSTEEKWEFGQGQVTWDSDGTAYTPDNVPYATVVTRNRFDAQTAFKDDLYDPLDPNTAYVNEEAISYGNITAIEIYYDPTGTGSANTQLTENVYDNIETATKWHLGRLLSSQVTSTIPEDPYNGGEVSETRTSAFEYDPTTGLLDKETIEPGHPDLEHITSYVRDAYGNITETTITTPQIPGGRIVSTQSNPDSTYRFYRTTENNLGHTESRTYDSVFGNLLSTTGPNGRTTHFEYDDWGRKIHEYTDDAADERLETNIIYEFDTTTVDINDNTGAYVQSHTAAYKVTTTATEAPTSISYYDKLGRVIREQTQDYSGQWVNRDTGYNALGQVVCASENYFDGDTPDLYTKSDYDLLGRVEFLTAPDGTQTKTEYNGLTTTVIRNFVEGGSDDNQNQKTITTKNIRGQTIQVTNGESGILDNTLQYQYDAFGNLAKTIVPGNDAATVTMYYDIRGNKISMVDPDMGEWFYTYNALGELIVQTDAKGQTTYMEYDSLGRMTLRTTDYQGANPETSRWYYDGDGEHDEIGALRLEVGPDDSRRSFYYDSFGRNFLTLDKIRIATGTNKDFKYYYQSSGYDAYSRVVHSATHWRPLELEADEFKLHYGWLSYGTQTTYNERGFVTEVKDTEGKVWWNAPQYNAQGNLETVYFGNGLKTEYRYNDENHTLHTIKTGDIIGADNRLQDYEVNFDVIGNIESRHNHKRGLSETFDYDRLNRLTESTTRSNLGGSSTNVEYNRLGNITYKSDAGAYTYDSSRPHAVTQVGNKSFAYDANGNMSQRNGTSPITWTAFNKVDKIIEGSNSSEFTYDANHNRITQIIRENDAEKKRKIYAGGMEQEETIVEGEWQTSLTRIFIGGPNGTLGAHIVKVDRSAENQFFLKDHLGSIVAVVDDSITPEITEEYSFDSWGKRRDFTDWIGEPEQSQDTAGIGDPTQSQDFKTDRGFTGHEMLDEVGLVHMNGRIYDADIGRFLSADSIIQEGSNLQSYNRYSYGMNRPLSGIDPSGQIFGFIAAVVAFTVKAAVAITTFAITVAINSIGFIASGIYGAATAGGLKSFLFYSSVIGGGAMGAANGGGIGGFVKGALFAAVSAGLSAGVGSAYGPITDNFFHELARAMEHGLFQGGFAELAGGDFGQGFLSAFAGSAAGSIMGQSGFVDVFGEAGSGWDNGRIVARTVAAAAVGGTVAEIGGGKFANGAVTAAMVHLFNAEAHGNTQGPEYEPDKWNDGGRIQNSTNCYAYACDRPGPYPLGHKLQPGELSGEKLLNVDAATVRDLSIKDGLLKPVGTLPEGAHRVYLVVGDVSVNGRVVAQDYHWYRQDSNGYWSHKPGHGLVTNLDSAGNLITNPATAARSTTYPRGVKVDYHTNGGELWVPKGF